MTPAKSAPAKSRQVKSIQVELIYEQSCPNIEDARTQILKAFQQANIPPQWQEWEVTHADTPDHAHGYGSPTVLVNGKDVSGEIPAGNDNCCRIYASSDGRPSGIPALSDIVYALQDNAPQDDVEPNKP